MRISDWSSDVCSSDLDVLAAQLDDDLTRLAAVDLLAAHAVQEVDGLGDARLQLGKGGFDIGKARDLDAGQPRGAAPHPVSGDLHLAGEGQHENGRGAWWGRACLYV